MQRIQFREIWRFLTLAYLLFFSFSLKAETKLLSFKGYVGKEEIARAQTALKELPSQEQNTLALFIRSTSGDVLQILDFAKQVYQEKRVNHLRVIVYIHDQALGPAAILPFLADEIDISYFMSWGDIPLGAEEVLPANILRNQVRSLIHGDSPREQTLRVLADGMTDPSLFVIAEGTWLVQREKPQTDQLLIASNQETLVVNHDQLQELGLVHAVISADDFLAQYTQIKDTEKEKEPEESPLAISTKTFEEQLAKHISFSKTEANPIGRIVITDRKGGINQSTWLYIKQALDFYRELKPRFIILELDTPGGEVFAAQEISNALQEMDTQYGIPIVALINHWAISAGAMLAYSSRFITTVKDGSMGAAEPVLMGAEGKAEQVSEKITSALRTDFANRAAFFDRNPLIAEAMVDKDLILVLRNGKIVQLTNEEQIRTTGPNPDQVITTKGKLLTLNAEQMLAYRVADAILPPAQRTPLTPQEKESGKWPAEKSPLFQIPYFQQIPNAQVVTYLMDWKTRFFVFLAMPMVQSVLFLIMLLGGYIEINTPGFGVPGTLAAIALFLILLSSFSLQIAHWLELIFLIAGLCLILAEIFVLPTAGILGVLGAILFLVGLFGIMIPGIGSIDFEYDTKTLNAAGEFFLRRFAWLSGTLLVGIVLIALLGRYVMPTFSGFQRFVLQGGEQEAAKGYVSGLQEKDLPQKGEEGIVLSPLRPVGKVQVGEGIYDAMTPGMFLEKETRIVVTARDGSTLVVEEKGDTT